VENKNAIIVDDIIDTAGTLSATINALKKKGAKKVFAACTHGIFSGQALARINEAPLEKIFVTNTIPRRGSLAECPKIEVLSVSKLFADAIESIHKETSVSKLFL
jgi:ribose-phosphate pyrophosphokinase